MKLILSSLKIIKLRNKFKSKAKSSGKTSKILGKNLRHTSGSVQGKYSLSQQAWVLKAVSPLKRACSKTLNVFLSGLGGKDRGKGDASWKGMPAWLLFNGTHWSSGAHKHLKELGYINKTQRDFVFTVQKWESFGASNHYEQEASLEDHSAVNSGLIEEKERKLRRSP